MGIPQLVRFIDDDDIPRYSAQLDFQLGGKLVRHDNDRFANHALKRGVNSEPLEVEPGHVVVLRVREHQDATPRTLEQSREEITRTLRERQAREALARDITALKTRAAQGVHLQTLAAETGAEFKDAGLVGRDANGVDRATLDTAFRLPQPAEGQIALVRCTQPGSPAGIDDSCWIVQRGDVGRAPESSF